MKINNLKKQLQNKQQDLHNKIRTYIPPDLLILHRALHEVEQNLYYLNRTEEMSKLPIDKLTYQLDHILNSTFSDSVNYHYEDSYCDHYLELLYRNETKIANKFKL